MIFVKLNGRLGNQIFQYVFAIAASRKLKTFYIIDDSIFVDYFFVYFQKPSVTDYKIIRRSFMALKDKPVKSLLLSGSEEPNQVVNNLTNNCYYDGYFQSTSFFEDLIPKIKNLIVIKKKFIRLFNQKIKTLSGAKKVLVIHFRLKDYVAWNVEELGGLDLSLPDSYYYNALKLVENLESYTVIVVSDDTKAATTRIPIITNRLIFSESEILDFQMLMTADKLIISNSSFAWWGAFLNEKNATVFAPKYWLGFKVKRYFPAGIMPERFTPVDVD